jgi:tetratricopeptide (TPR) repeat protein
MVTKLLSCLCLFFLCQFLCGAGLGYDVATVEKVEQLIAASEYDTDKLGQLYFQLGYLLYHSWINKVKLGSRNMLYESAEALQKAVSYLQNNKISLHVLIESLSMRATVLKMIGRGAEALLSYDEALKYGLHVVDKAALYYGKGDVYLMMGKLSEAIAEYEQSFQFTPCKTERYHGYVTTLKEWNRYTIDEWKNLTNHLINIERTCHVSIDEQRKLAEKQFHLKPSKASSSSSSSTSKKKSRAVTIYDSEFEDYEDDYDYGYDMDDDDDDDDNNHNHNDHDDKNMKNKPPLKTPSTTITIDNNQDHHMNITKLLLFSDIIAGSQATKHSDLCYAIYMTADLAKEPTLAWHYLMKANDVEYASRSMTFDTHQSILAKNNTVNIFTSSFLASFPDIRDHDDISWIQPIFIVGMMRSGSTLLETMLDSTDSIWGMGEDSVFNSNLTTLRDNLVSATSNPGSYGQQQQQQSNMKSLSKKQQAAKSAAWKAYEQQVQQLQQILIDYHVSTMEEMTRLALLGNLDDDQQHQHGQQQQQLPSSSSAESTLSSASSSSHERHHGKKDVSQLKFIVDKMLFNYRNIGKQH